VYGEPEFSGNSFGALRPYIAVPIQIRLWEIIYAQGRVKTFFGPKLNANIDNDILTVNAFNEIGLKIDGEVGLDAYVFKWSKNFGDFVDYVKKIGDTKEIYKKELIVWPRYQTNVSTPVPYPNNYQKTFTFSKPGARKIKLHFKKFSTEQDRDIVYYYDKHGLLIGKQSGNSTFSPIVYGDTIIMKVTSDKNINDDGKKPYYVEVDEVYYMN
jgi:hypothetical protein